MTNTVNTITNILEFQTKNLESWRKAASAGDKFQDRMDKSRETIRRRNAAMDKEQAKIKERGEWYDQMTSKLGLSQSELDRVMSASGLSMNKNNQVVDRAGRVTEDYTQTLMDNKRAASKFRMAYLGLMFGGMALNRAMQGLNATAKEWFGIGEITSSMLGVLMTPAMEDYLTYGVLPVAQTLMNLPEDLQAHLGRLSLLFEGAGWTAMNLGQVLLGIFALKDISPKIYDKIGGLKGGISKAFGGLFIFEALQFEIQALTSKDSKDVALNTLGAGIASALGLTLIGASASGIVLGGAIAVTIPLIWKFVEAAAEQSQAYNEIGQDVTNAAEAAMRGEDQGYFAQGTRITTPAVPSELSNMQIDFSGINATLPSGGMNVTYNISTQVSDKKEWLKDIYQLTESQNAELKRIVGGKR